jgi:hypothetical protein
MMPDLPISNAAEALLTPLALSILRQGGERAYGRLVVHGPPDGAASLLGGVAPQELIARPIKHADNARAVLSGLWLFLDALDESHRLSQEIVSTTGSFWHAIMHRREGDFSNSKYWYNRCANHHVLRLLGAVAGSLAGDSAADRTVARALSDGWNPNGFVDLVAAVHDKPNDPRHAVAVKLQKAEWSGLFDYCVHEAVEADRTDLEGWESRLGNL